MTDRNLAIRAAKQFGNEAKQDNVTWSAEERKNIAEYYGVENWLDIPEEDQDYLKKCWDYGYRLKNEVIE